VLEAFGWPGDELDLFHERFPPFFSRKIPQSQRNKPLSVSVNVPFGGGGTKRQNLETNRAEEQESKNRKVPRFGNEAFCQSR
jgi:hypothetical protein